MVLGILLLASLLLGWFPHHPPLATLEARVRAHVSDESRRATALRALETIDGEVRRYDRLTRGRAAEVARLVRTQRTAAPAFEQLFGSLDADRAVAMRRILDARFALAGALDEEEWRGVVDP